MRSKVLAIVLIVLGVGATLGGVYGQVFLAEDDGHHDDRTPTFALESQIGIDELVVDVVGDGAVVADVRRSGQQLGLDDLHDGVAHYFVVDERLSTFDHTVADMSGPTPLGAPVGLTRVIAQVAPSSGTDFLELGVTVDVPGTIDEDPPVIDADQWTDGSITIDRQGFDFVLSEAWNGDDVYEGPAFLTLIRTEDFAFAHAHAELVGDNRFSFATDLPGLGDYLAALEFEQNSELVTALFRFTL